MNIVRFILGWSCFIFLSYGCMVLWYQHDAVALQHAIARMQESILVLDQEIMLLQKDIVASKKVDALTQALAPQEFYPLSVKQVRRF